MEIRKSQKIKHLISDKQLRTRIQTRTQDIGIHIEESIVICPDCGEEVIQRIDYDNNTLEIINHKCSKDKCPKDKSDLLTPLVP